MKKIIRKGFKSPTSIPKKFFEIETEDAILHFGTNESLSDHLGITSKTLYNRHLQYNDVDRFTDGGVEVIIRRRTKPSYK